MRRVNKTKFKSQEFFIYTKSLNSYSYYAVYTNNKSSSVSHYSIGNNIFEYCTFKPSQAEVSEIINNGLVVDEKYSELLHVIYIRILTAAKSLLNLLIQDEELRDLIDEDKFEFDVQTWAGYDSVTASVSRFSFYLRDGCLSMEQTFSNGYDIDYVPNPPYLFVIHFFNEKYGIKGDYKTTITEEIYKVIESTLITVIEILSELFYTFDKIFNEQKDVEPSK